MGRHVLAVRMQVAAHKERAGHMQAVARRGEAGQLQVAVHTVAAGMKQQVVAAQAIAQILSPCSFTAQNGVYWDTVPGSADRREK